MLQPHTPTHLPAVLLCSITPSTLSVSKVARMTVTDWSDSDGDIAS